MNHHKQIRHILALECGAWKNTFFLDKNTHSLGRNSTNSIFCYHRVISRNHANLIKVNYQNLANKNESQNIFWLVDGDGTGKRSTNGIYVNGEKCLSHLLQPGDIIFFGGNDVKGKYDILDLKTHSFYSESSTATENSSFLETFSYKPQDSFPVELDSSQLNSFELISEAILIVNFASKTIINANSNACNLLGYSLAEIKRLNINNIDKVEQSILSQQLDFLQNLNISSQRESAYQTKEKKLVNVLVKSRTINYEDQKCLFLEIKDISYSKKIEYILRYQNNHDLLTNCGNEQLFKKQLSYCLGYNKVKETQLAIVKIRFNYTGNKLSLQKRIISRIRKRLFLMDSLAKVSSNEYYIMLQEVNSKARIDLFVNQVLEDINQPIVIENQSFLLTANMGISLQPQDGQEIDELLQKSSLALEASYDQSLNNYQYYKANFLQQRDQEYQEEKILSEILRSKNINIKYQPVIDLNNDQIFGFTSELLKSQGIATTNSLVNYFKVAHRIGYTLDLMRLCLQTIASDVNLWQKNEISWDRISIPILLSSLLDDHLLNSLLVLWKDFEDKIPNLELDVFIDDNLFFRHQKSQPLFNLTKISRNLTLSNFGFNQGLNILSYSDFVQNIKISLPIDVKLENEPKQKALITSLLTFTNILKINLIVDNISTKKQKEILFEMGCEIVAGAGVTPSLSAHNIVKFYKNW